MNTGGKVRVLIVDDSAIVRKLLGEALAGDAGIEVVGTAPDPYVARDKILRLNPDVLTLDIEMPRMDGITFLEKLMRFHPLPVVVISSLAQPACHAAIRALELGAVEVMAKPGGPYSVGELSRTLVSKVRAAARARIRRAPAVPAAAPAPIPAPESAAGHGWPYRMIAIGASTGGTEAIASILARLPATAPPIAIVQHIPAQFSRAFAARLNEICEIEVKEASDGDRLRPGLALVAPGDFHMVLRRGSAAGCYVNVKTGPRVCYQRPSVDVLFLSVAEAAGAASAGVLLTGMGSDGAQGLLSMRRAGAHTIAQNESSCVVFGMPREAIERGAAAEVLPLASIPQALIAARRPAPAISCKLQ